MPEQTDDPEPSWYQRQQTMKDMIQAGLERRAAEAKEYALWVVERLGECAVDPDFTVEMQHYKPSRQGGWKPTRKRTPMGSGWSFVERPGGWVEAHEETVGTASDRIPETTIKVKGFAYPPSGWCLLDSGSIVNYTRDNGSRIADVNEKAHSYTDFTSPYVPSPPNGGWIPPGSITPKQQADALIELAGITDLTGWEDKLADRTSFENLLRLNSWHVVFDQFVDARNIAEQ